MRQTLHRRLRELEVESDRARVQAKLKEQDGKPSAALSKFLLFLQMRGIEPGPCESIAEASARALEITSSELSTQLSQGIDPIHKYLTEHGVFEEIERRKAAGTWPSGEKEWNNATA
jgi:hypothetical protein